MIRVRLLVSALIVTLAAGCVAHVAAGRTFYVSPKGSDRNHGRSPKRAWRTIARVDRAHLRPGDRVLFQGGATFTDETLTPPASGTSGHPIVFGSYGPGRATLAHRDGAVWFSGRKYLTFTQLVLTTRNANGVIFAGSSRASTHITLEHSVLRDSNYSAINQPNRGDSAWTIEDNVIEHVGDSGLILNGSGDVVSGNTIRDVGWNPALDYGKHGIYAKGPRLTVEDNTITGFPNGSGISLRSRDALVTGNRISSGAIGISFYREDSSAGTSQLVDNHIGPVSVTGFYYSSGGGERFVVQRNTFTMDGGTALDLEGRPTGNLVVSRNVLRGAFDYVLVAPSLAGALKESGNWFTGEPRFSWQGRRLSYEQYRAQSGQAAGDRIIPP
jgi:hypothetical protein